MECSHLREGERVFQARIQLNAAAKDARHPLRLAAGKRFPAEGRTTTHVKDMTMKIVIMKPSVATAIAGAMAIGFATASCAAPVLSNSAPLIGGLPTTATYVDDRGGSRGSGTNTRLLEGLALGAYGVPASPSTTTPSNDVTARPNSSYGSTPNPYGALYGNNRRQR
jgi:hypothetical protein